MWEYIGKGGVFIYPLVFCSILALGIIIERFITLRRTREKVGGLINRLNEAIGLDPTESTGHEVVDSKINNAIRICENAGTNLANIYKSGLLAIQQERKNPTQTEPFDKEKVKNAFQESAGLELPSLEKNLGILSTIAHIAPLLGFLGTVAGMIRAFQEIQRLAAGGEAIGPGDLAGGIWEALITTAVGLVIAIPTYVAYSCFKGYTAKIVEKMERGAVEMVDSLRR